MNIKIVDRIAIFFIVFWVLALIPNPITIFVLSKFLRVQFDFFIQVHAAVFSVINYLDKIVIALWLFVQAKHDKVSRWVWALFGLIFGISAVFLYFLIQLLYEKKLKNAILREEQLKLE